MTRVIAPGKLVIVGEYAVLDGAPAIVAAVDSGVACTVYDAASVEITVPNGMKDDFVRAALAAVHAPSGRYTFTEHNPTATDGKAGLGGSGASVVAACLAGSIGSGHILTGHALADIAQRVHREVQGSGSGIDIMASAHGGVLRVHGRDVIPGPAIEPVIVYSGTSAKTGPRVAQYRALSRRRSFVQMSTDIVNDFASDPVAALGENRALLEAMAQRAGIAYRTPGLDRIIDLADDCGGAAKPSGAGGGDVAVALFHDGGQALDFRLRCAQDGFVVLSVRVDPQGARVVLGGE